MSRVIRHIKPPVCPVVEYHLILSKDEAETLQIILRNISGNADTTRRSHADDMREQLEGAGVSDIDEKVDGDVRFSIRYNHGDG